MLFEKFSLDNDLLYSLESMNFKDATPIQEQAIPKILAGSDILACAQTGTGKTAAFLLPIMNNLISKGYPKDKVNCVVMVPTRELALQIEQQVEAFGYFIDISAVAIYGGTDGITFEKQRKALQLGVDIVIATPGRLLSLLRLKEADLSNLGFFVLDEADRMLDMGFMEDILEIIKDIPSSCQRLLFSATMPSKIKKLAGSILNDPDIIELSISKPPESILQFAYSCYEHQKIPILKSLLMQDKPERTIIFTSSKLNAHNLKRELSSCGFSIKEMHSDLDQQDREYVLRDFKNGNIDVIVATNIMARGIDIDNIRSVINFDVPRDAEDYIHRIGRTARGNNDNGLAITFINEEEQARFADIERLLERSIYKLPIDIEFGEAPIYKGKSKAQDKSGQKPRSTSRKKKTNNKYKR